MAPQPVDLPIEGAAALKAAIVTVTLIYKTADTLVWKSSARAMRSMRTAHGTRAESVSPPRGLPAQLDQLFQLIECGARIPEQEINIHKAADLVLVECRPGATPMMAWGTAMRAATTSRTRSVEVGARC